MAVKIAVYGTANMKEIIDARKTLDDLERQAAGNSSRFATSMSKFSYSAENAGRKMTNAGNAMTRNMTVPLAALGAGLYKATQMAADDAQAQVVLANTLKNTAGATAAQTASVENWITAQGKALGVTDDQLRPAIGALATATGDLSKAQLLASAAMNISAQKGLPLESVANALAKAYAGNTTSLGKMLPGIDQAAIKSKNFGAIMDSVNKITGGAAAAAANTEAGARQRANVALQESIESLGASFLPIMGDVTNLMTTQVVPAIQQMTAWFSSLDTGTQGNIVKLGLFVAALGPVVSVTGSVVSGLGGAAKGIGFVAEKSVAAAGGVSNFVQGLKGYAWNAEGAATPALKFGNALRSGATKMAEFVVGLAKQGAALAVSAAKWVAQTAAMVAHKVASFAVSAASKAVAVSQWAVNAAMSANPIGLVVIAIAALVGGLVLLWNKNEGFRNFIIGAWEKIKGAFVSVLDWVKKNWPLLLGILTGPVGLAVLLIAKNWDKIKAATAAAFDTVKSVISGAWEFVKNAFLRFTLLGVVISHWTKIVDFFKGVPDKIKGAFHDINAKMAAVGKAIIDGIWAGIQNGWDWLKGKVSDVAGSLLDAAKDALGINSPSKEFAKLGKWSSQGLAKGLKDGAPAAIKQSQKLAQDTVTRHYQAMAAALKSGKAVVKDGHVALVVSDPWGDSTSKAETFTKKVDKAAEAMKKLKDATKGAMSAWGLGDTPQASTLTPASMLASAQAQAAAAQNFVANMSKLRKSGLNGGVMSSLLAGGPAQSGAQAAALAGMSAGELKMFNEARNTQWQYSQMAGKMQTNRKYAPNVTIAPNAVQVTIQGNATAADVEAGVSAALAQLTKELRSA